MSASSSRTMGETGEIVSTPRGRGRAPRSSGLYGLIATDGSAAPAVARLTLGLVMLPHALQKLLGLFGGYGLAGTYGYFTTKLGLPSVLAATASICEIGGAILLVLGAFSRLGAAAIMAVMIGAVVTTHLPNGFFMNWTGQQAGEGIEYHLLATALAVVVIIKGGGAWSTDNLLQKRHPEERRPAP
jgi:putative oxidoreductase